MTHRFIHRAAGVAAFAFVAALIAAAPSTKPTTVEVDAWTVVPVSAAERERMHLSPFYTQYCASSDFPIVASAHPSPYALKEAAFLIDKMLSPRPEVRQAMIASGVHCTVMAVSEMTTDVPEHSGLTPKSYWDRRARGLGATPEAPCVSCGEENLLALNGDPYATENILIHEFAHAIHETGLYAVDKTFDERLKDAFEKAIAEGLWKNTYAATNRAEYWAEGTQSWFDCNRVNDSSHNDVNTREKLKRYDPRLSALLLEVYGDGDWRYARPTSRPSAAHLAGFDRASAPTFQWPQPATTRSSTRPSGQQG